eukprot:101234-Prorocentrum_minimum.AAC.1
MLRAIVWMLRAIVWMLRAPAATTCETICPFSFCSQLAGGVRGEPPGASGAHGPPAVHGLRAGSGGVPRRRGDGLPRGSRSPGNPARRGAAARAPAGGARRGAPHPL